MLSTATEISREESFLKKLSEDPKKLEQIFNFVIGYRVASAGQKNSFYLKKIRDYYKTLYLEPLIHQLEKENTWHRFSPGKILEEICAQLISSQEANEAWAIQFLVAHHKAGSSINRPRLLSHWRYTPIYAEIFNTLTRRIKLTNTQAQDAKPLIVSNNNNIFSAFKFVFFGSDEQVTKASASAFDCFIPFIFFCRI